MAEGRLFGEMYYIEGMVGWKDIKRYSERPAREGEEIHIAVGWVNESDYPIAGHIDLSLISPSGVEYKPPASLNQDREAEPNKGWWVQFEPVKMDEAGVWTLKAVLSSGGVVLDENGRELDVASPVVDIWLIPILLGLLGAIGGAYYLFRR